MQNVRLVFRSRQPNRNDTEEIEARDEVHAFNLLEHSERDDPAELWRGEIKLCEIFRTGNRGRHIWQIHPPGQKRPFDSG